MPCKYLMMDEVDAYPVDADGEGDPVSLAIKRTSTFNKKKILMISTPTIKGMSRIEKEYYENSDARRFFLPCPHCNREQFLNGLTLDGIKMRMVTIYLKPHIMNVRLAKRK